MPRFLVTLHYTVAPAVPGRSHSAVLAPLIGPGHRFSMLGPDLLAVGVRMKAPTAREAAELVDARVRAAWPMVGGGMLTMATAVVNGDLVRVGAAPSASSAAPRRRRGRGLSPTGRERGWWDDPRDEGDDGTAGVREPRRPKTPPGGLYAATTPPTG